MECWPCLNHRRERVIGSRHRERHVVDDLAITSAALRSTFDAVDTFKVK